MKKTVAAIVSAAMLAASFSAIGFTTAEPVSISASESSVITSDLLAALEKASEDTKLNVWIWLKDSNAPDFTALTNEKISPKTAEEAEWYYSLSEYEQSELFRTTRLELVKEYYSSKNKDFIEAHNIAEEDISFLSSGMPSMICSLTPAQIYEIADDSTVESLSLDDRKEVPTEIPTENLTESSTELPTELPTEIPTESFTELTTESKALTEEEFCEAFFSADENFSDGGVIYTYGNKAAIKLNDSYYTGEDRFIGTVIIYGFETPEDIRYVKENIGDYEYSESPVGFHSGWCYGYINALKDTELLKKGQELRIVYFANNTITDLNRKNLNLIEAYNRYGFDVAPYVYTTLTPGDTDCDGTISSSDASLVLEAYAMLSTGQKLEVNQTIFDYNNDGEINSLDASDILAAYADSMTS